VIEVGTKVSNEYMTFVTAGLMVYDFTFIFTHLADAFIQRDLQVRDISKASVQWETLV